MSVNTFAFKEFEIVQGKCTMKISTDSVLLGAWVNPEKAKRILDIGTGTGVISLMLAQRSNCPIVAIDICKESYLEAQQNFLRSKWYSRIKPHHISVQDFVFDEGFDLIVSNPPYFCLPHTHREKQGIEGRYSHLLPFDELAESVIRLLTPKGRFCVILPIHEAAHFANQAEKRKLYLTKYVWIKTTNRKRFPKRILMQFELERAEISDSDDPILVIQGDNSYTKEYVELTRDYYINF